MPLLTYLADTNAVSDWLRKVEPVVSWFSEHKGTVAISTVTLAELRFGIEMLPASKARRDLEQNFQWLFEDYEGRIWLFDESAAFEWGRLMAEARNHPLPFDDSLIAAIARSMDATVITRNVKHFPGCYTVDPWTGKESSPWEPPVNRT